MTMNKAIAGETYEVVSVNTNQKTQTFLKTLGLYEGSQITLISKVGTNYILNIKDSRYAVDVQMASQVVVKDNTSRGE